MTHKYKLQALAAAVLGAAVLAGGPAFASEKITIMVGGINKLIYLPGALTQRLGYFKDEGLDVELQSQQAGVAAENQLIAGAVQGVVGFYDHSIDLQSKGKSIEAVTLFGKVPGGVEMIRSDDAGKIKSVADLKGKSLGVTGLGSSSSFITEYLADRAGLKPGSYSLLPVGAGNSLIAALRQKRVDMAWVTEPTTSMLLSSGEAKVLVDMVSSEGTRKALGGEYPAASFYMKTEWVQAHPAEVQKLVNAFVRTLHFIQTHTAEQIADKMPADYYGGNKDLYVKAMQASLPMYSPDGRMPKEGPEVVLKVFQAFNPNVKGKTIDLGKTYTNQFVDKANLTLKKK